MYMYVYIYIMYIIFYDKYIYLYTMVQEQTKHDQIYGSIGTPSLIYNPWVADAKNDRISHE